MPVGTVMYAERAVLYIVSTPIGNLGDITFRAVEILRACDYILCEDTRHSRRLFKHYQITAPLRSYHRFNEKKQLDRVLADLLLDKTVALVSDAGTPLCSDPGSVLVQACHAAHLPVVVVPGPCAAIAALTLSGMQASRWQFVGFMPKSASKFQQLLVLLLGYDGVSICYEAPHRIIQFLEAVHQLDPVRKLVLVREMTKIHEECLSGFPEELLISFRVHPPKGEFVLLISGRDDEKWAKHEHDQDVVDHVLGIQRRFQLGLREAIAMCAQLRGQPKRQIYQEFHRLPPSTNIQTRIDP